MSLFRKRTSKRTTDAFANAISEANKKRNQIQSIIIQQQKPYREDFGYVPENPICSLNLSWNEGYLNRICTQDGRKFAWNGPSTVRVKIANLEDIGIDEYVLILEGNIYKRLYFATYTGNTKFPPYGLTFSDDMRDWDTEREAFEKGVTVEQLKEIKRLEQEAKVRKMLEQVKIGESLDKYLPEVTEKYPAFVLSQERRNPLFSKLVSTGYNTLAVYEYVHKDTLFTRVDSECSKVEEKTVNDYCQYLLQKNGISKPVTENIASKPKSVLCSEAAKLGISVENLIEIREMENENRILKYDMELKRYEKLAAEAKETHNMFPCFDFFQDYENEWFRKISSVVDMQTAHEIIHFGEYYIPREKASATDNTSPIASVYCRKCGTLLYEDSVFCHKCGTKAP